LHCCNKAVSATRKGFQKAWPLGRVAQGLSHFADGGVQAIVEVDKGIVLPQALVKFFAAYDLARVSGQVRKQFEGLPLEAHHGTIAMQLPGTQINLEVRE
jgi:hypothetical protein